MKKIIFFALSIALSVFSINAQIVQGDMNDDSVIDVTDASEIINIILGQRAYQYLDGIANPYMIDSSKVVGTWYKTKSESFSLNADGTTDYNGAATYKFLPYQGVIMFYNEQGKPVSKINVSLLNEGYMLCIPMETGVLTILTTTQPKQQVTSIQFVLSTLSLQLGQEMPVLAIVMPTTADNRVVTYESSDESVVRMQGRTAVAVGVGTATITCRATDGSGVKATCKINVNPKDLSGTDANGREYVDLDLPSGTLWAAWNVGANAATESGLYFAWGETRGYAKGESHTFNWKNYKWMTPGHSNEKYVTKYTVADHILDGVWYKDNVYVGTVVDGVTYKDLSRLLPEDDAATANWGDEWCMPTTNQIYELKDSRYTTTEWVTVNGVSGRKITSKSNGKSIFLPAAGSRYDSKLSNEGYDGSYWMRDLGLSSLRGSSLEFDDSGIVYFELTSRSVGQSVRAVRAK